MSFKSLKQLTAGVHAVNEAMDDGRAFERLFVRKGLRGKAIEEILEKAKERKVPFSFVPVEKLDRLTNVAHQGVVALHSLIEYQDIDDIVPFIYEAGKTPLVLVLDRVTDVRNFGAIARTAECLGAHCIVIPERGAAQINTEAIKTSSGALGRIPVCRVPDLSKALLYLQQCGLSLVAATEKGEHLLYQADMTGPLAVVMGSEGEGVESNLLELCDAHLRIPISSKTDSLNVSVACGMFLYEVTRQRVLS